MNFCIPGNIHKGGEKFMEQNVSMGRVLSFCEWVLKFFYANLLWFVFTMLGLGVFGFMPATTALFSVTRKWIMGKTDIPIFKTFWQLRTAASFFVPTPSVSFWRRPASSFM